ncbi:MAG TPA: hypothetical protein EYN51_03130 [Flavobacteriales bacterium]|nr:hypothetical protein [Flavobacteriales bacterium]HIA12802.1 hypothetical protein [Flavobacteriales bacterium]
MVMAEKLVDKNIVDTELLSLVGKNISKHLSVNLIAENLYQELNQLMDADIFGVGLLDKEGKALVFRGVYERGKVLDEYQIDLSEDRMAIRCFKNIEEIEIKDWGKEHKKYVSKTYKAKAGELPESLIYHPLVVDDKVIGVISVQSFMKHAYSQNHLLIIRNLAQYVALALENAKLYEGLEEEVKKRTAEINSQKEELEKNYANTTLLSEIGLQITSSLDFESIFKKLHANVNKLMDAEVFGVRIFHEEDNLIEYKYEIESGERHPIQFIPYTDDDNYSVWCIKNMKEIILNDNEKEYRKYVNEIKVVAGEMPNSLIFYPMIIGKDVVGVITVQSFKFNAYGSYELDILKTLASYTGIALANAKLYESLEEKVEERTKEVTIQSEELADRNKDITDNIAYAKLIQQSLLPSDNVVRKMLSKHFIFYLPKDMVSGDFYWFEEVDNKIFFALGDCTGHGVAGAFMTIVSLNILNQALLGQRLRSTSEILDFLETKVNKTWQLNQKKGIRRMDGLDIAICCFDKKNSTLEFSGAQSPLYLIRKNRIYKYKADRRSIGLITEKKKPLFTSQLIQIEKSDLVYLSSDGYKDQFGKEAARKYGEKRFSELIKNITKGSIKQQKIDLEIEFIRWKGSERQVDDVCVVGIQF